METQFARVGNERVAYQVIGEGPRTLLFNAGSFNNVDVWWEDAGTARLFRALAGICRLILVDRRGSGASDPLPDGAPGWEAWIEDFEAVMDATRTQRVTLLAALDAGPTGILMGATQPERLDALVLVNTFARLLEAPDYEVGVTEPTFAAALAAFDQGWGTIELARMLNPEQSEDEVFLHWYARYQRSSCTRSSVLRFLEQWASLDVRAMLPLVSVPVVVISRQRSTFGIKGIEGGRYIAERIADARFVALAGEGGVLGPSALQLLEPLEEILGASVARPSRERVLATVVFTDIVDSTGLAASLGDRHWGRFLDAYEDVARRETDHFRGRVIKSTGDGSLLTFNSPTAALRAVCAIEREARAQGLSIRAGVHTGEIELRGDDIGGIGVHIAQRVSACAGPGEVVVSSTVKDLLTGSDIDFDDRGEHHLKGVLQPWQLFAVAG